MKEQMLIQNPMQLCRIRIHPTKPNIAIVVLRLLLMPIFLLLHLIWNCIKFSTFSFFTYFDAHLCSFVFMLFVVNENALVITSFYEASLYCLNLISFILHHTIFQSKGMFSVGQGFGCERFIVLMALFFDWRQLEIVCFVLIRVTTNVC